MEKAGGGIGKLIIETSKGPVIQVYVKPSSDREELVLEEGDLVFYTREPPVEGRANSALIRYLSRHLKIPSSRIDIVYGWRKRSKRILFIDTDPDELAEKLSALVSGK